MVSGDVRLPVSKAFAGERLDRFLARRLQISRAECQRWIADGRVTIEGQRARKGIAVEEGMTVNVSAPNESLQGDPRAPLRIVVESPRWVVVDKPAGQPTTALRTDDTGTLANALVARFPAMRAFGHRAVEAGLVHRLDTHTSGLVIAAKDAAAFFALTRALRSGEIVKRYYAVVRDGVLADDGLVEAALEPDPRNPRRVRVGDSEASPRRTAYRVLRRGDGLCLLDVVASRAYRHQIRAHLAHLGAPLVGDALYGGSTTPRLAPERHALHAYHVAWEGDDDLPKLEATLPLAGDLDALFSARGSSTSSTSRTS